MRTEESSHLIPKLTPRQLVLGTLVVLAVGLGFWLVYRFGHLLFLLFIAFVVATAARQLVRPLEARGLSRLAATGVVYCLILILGITLVLLLLPLTIERTADLARILPDAYHDLRQFMLAQPNDLIWRLGSELPDELNLALSSNQPADDGMNGLFAGLGQLFGDMVEAAFNIVVVLLLSFYWVLRGDRVKQALLLAIPYDRRTGTRDFVDEAETRIGAYVAGQATLSLVVGVMALVAYLIIGLPYAGLLALLAGLLEALPLIGPVLATIPPVLVALSQDPLKAIWVVLAMGAIQQLENGYLVPRVMRRSVGIHPLVTLLAIAAFSLLFGIAGAIAAIPVAALVQLLLNRYSLQGELVEPAVPNGRDRLSRLQYEAKELATDARNIEVAEAVPLTLDNGRYVEEELEDIALELTRLLNSDRESQSPQES